MHLAKTSDQTFLILRDGNDVNVVVHEAVGPNLNLMRSRTFPKKLPVGKAILIREEYTLISIAPLRDVVGKFGATMRAIRAMTIG